MKTINHHDARGPEETVHDLPPMVPAESASGRPPAGLRQAGLPEDPASKNTGELARSESGLLHRLADRPSRNASRIAGPPATATPTEPTSLELRERPVRCARH